MTSFHHDNVLSLIGISFDTNGFPIVVMPYMSNGSLIDHVQNKNVNLEIHDLLKFALDVAQGKIPETFFSTTHTGKYNFVDPLHPRPYLHTCRAEILRLVYMSIGPKPRALVYGD